MKLSSRVPSPARPTPEEKNVRPAKSSGPRPKTRPPQVEASFQRSSEATYEANATPGRSLSRGWVGAPQTSQAAPRCPTFSAVAIRSAERAVIKAPKDDRMVIYQMMPRTFGNVTGANVPGGDRDTNGVGKFSHINAAALDAIKAQGYTHVYLTGVLRHATATDYSAIGLPADDPDIVKGRAGSPFAIKDYFDVSPDYANEPTQRMQEFEALLARAKARGLGVMIDLVPNHVARSYASTVRPDVSFGAGDDPSKRFDPQNNFFYLTDQPGRPLTIQQSAPLPGSDGRFGPEDGGPGRTPKATGNRAAYDVDANDWYETIKLNYGYDPETHQKCFNPIPDTWLKMDEVIHYWQEKGVDGFRVDYAHVVPVEFWHWALERARQRNPKTRFIAEAYEQSPDKIPGFRLEHLVEAGFDGVYHAELFHGLRELVAGPKWANDIDAWLDEHASIQDHLVRYAENHDEPRVAGTLRPHDIWNSGLGDAKAGQPLSAVLFLTGSGPNLLYAGQEVGEPGDGKEGFGEDDARTTIFDYWTMPEHARWVGTDHAYREDQLTPSQRELRRFYRQLNHLARQPPFTHGGLFKLQAFNAGRPDYDSGEHVYSFMRYDGEGRRALVVVNFSRDQSQRPTVRLPKEALRAAGLEGAVQLKARLGNAPTKTHLPADVLTSRGVTVELPPFGVSVIELQ